MLQIRKLDQIKTKIIRTGGTLFLKTAINLTKQRTINVEDEVAIGVASSRSN